MAKTDQRNKKDNGRTGTRGGRRIGSAARPTAARGSAARSSGAGPATASMPTPSPDTAESVTEAVALLESFVSSFEPGRYSGDDAALLVDRFSRGEHLCATNNNVL
jgi:hypothetical protein